MNENVERMAVMWNRDGLSQAEIASAMGLTRHAVAGVIFRHRDKFNRRRSGTRYAADHVKPPRKEPQKANQRRKAFHEAKAAKAEKIASLPFLSPPVEPVITPTEYDQARKSKAKTLLDIGRCECRWPLTSDHPHMFCAAEAVSGSAYCAHHRARAKGKGTISEQKAVIEAKRIAA